MLYKAAKTKLPAYMCSGYKVLVTYIALKHPRRNYVSPEYHGDKVDIELRNNGEAEH